MEEVVDMSHLEPDSTIVTKIEELTSAVLDTKVSARMSLELTLWATKDVAKYVGVSYKYASEHLVTHHTFPNALRLPTKRSPKGHPRWYAGEVIKWVAANQEG